MRSAVRIVGVAVALAASTPGATTAAELYFVDAHSQMARGLDENVILPLMDKAGVWHTVLSARNDRSPNEVAAFAAAHPDRITAAVRSKGMQFNVNRPEYLKLLSSQLDNPVFKAMAEILFFHAEKGRKAPEIKVSIDAPQSQLTLQAAFQRGWPVVAHYEFAAAGWDKSKLMGELETTLARNRDHPFVLIHMGQLEADEAASLLARHANLHFMTSHSNPITRAESQRQPWVDLFAEDALASKWRHLFESYPERFILGFDNVWPEHWSSFYLRQADLWRAALAQLPEPVAHAVAHANAERLWKLPRKTN